MPFIDPIVGSHFVTITLSPKVYKYSSTTQFEFTVHELECALRSSSELFQCVPELTNDGNVHYHAWVKFNDKYQLVSFINKIKRMRGRFGFVKVNRETIENVSRVKEYMLKEYKITDKTIKSVRPLIMQSDKLDPRLAKWRTEPTEEPQFPIHEICEVCTEIKDFCCC